MSDTVAALHHITSSIWIWHLVSLLYCQAAFLHMEKSSQIKEHWNHQHVTVPIGCQGYSHAAFSAIYNLRRADKLRNMEEALGTICEILGISLQDELSSREISLLYKNVYNMRVDLQEVIDAMRKVRESYNGAYSPTEVIAETLLEIENQHFLKEQIYWDFRLLNTDEQGQASLLKSEHLLQSIKENAFMSGQDIFLHNVMQNQTQDTQSESDGKINILLYLQRLKNKARNLCDRWSSEGLMALLLEKEEEHNFSITYHLTFWDIFRVLEEKYKTLLQKLCMEMLKEHYGTSMWDSMSVVQQEEKLEELHVLAEDALENNDFLSMSNLPGAFRNYRSANGLMLRNCLEENISDNGLEWTAVYNLWELYKNYKMEKTYTLKKITHSNKSDLQEPESMVFSLYMKAIYMKVKRERHFLPAFLVAYPCLEKWSDVMSPDQEQLARWWIEKGIKSDGVKQFTKLEGHTKQETAVECLLLRQEWERCYFIRLLHNLSLEDFNENQEISPNLNADLSSFSDDLLESTSILRVATARKLWQVKSSFQLKVTWGDCAVCLLTELIQHQERELRSAVMILVSKNEENCLALQDQYESELKEKRSDHLIWLLFSHQMKNALVIQPTDNAQAHEEGFTEEDANVKTGNKPEAHSEISAVEEETHQIILTQQEENEICSACGNALTANEIPYLEVMGTEDMTEEYSKLDEICVEGDVSGHIPNYEKQGSLIASAWSKDTEDIRDTEHEAEETGQTDKQRHEILLRETNEELPPGSAKSTNSLFREEPIQAEDTKKEEFSCKEAVLHISEMDKEETMRSLVDLQRKAENKLQRDKERQMLRVQERLSIMRNRKSDEDLLGNKEGDGFRHFTEDLKMVNKTHQRTLVKRKLEQLRRERTCIMQSKRERNMAGFQELLDPLVHGSLTAEEKNKSSEEK